MATLRAMGYGEGSLYRRKRTGQWVASLTMRDGRRVTRVSKDKAVAQAGLVELRRLRDAGAPITDRIRLGPYLERWVSDVRRLAPGTRRKHESIIRVHLIPELGHVRLSDLRVGDVDATLQRLTDRGLHPQSARHVRATLRRALRDALRDGLVGRNVASLSAPPPLETRERTILDATAARRLIEATRNTRYGPLWTILVTTGLRISEALGLTWSAVEMGGGDAAHAATSYLPARDGARDRGAAVRGEAPGRGRVRLPAGTRRPDVAPSLTVRHQLAREAGEWVFRPPKTAKGRRTIPLTPLGVEALRAQRKLQDADLGSHPRPIDGLVFTSSRGQPLHETNTLKALYADLAAAGLPKISQHDLRHSCATLLYSMGVPLETIADILGHSSVRVTQDLYRHRVAELSVAAAERMQEALG